MNTSDLWITIAKTIPELIVMVIIVKAFLHAMATRDKLFTEAMDKINLENLEARQISRKVIEENSLQTKQCTIAMVEMTSSLKELRNPVIKST